MHLHNQRIRDARMGDVHCTLHHMRELTDPTEVRDRAARRIAEIVERVQHAPQIDANVHSRKDPQQHSSAQHGPVGLRRPALVQQDVQARHEGHAEDAWTIGVPERTPQTSAHDAAREQERTTYHTAPTRGRSQ